MNNDKFHLLSSILAPIASMQKMTLPFHSNLVLRSYLLYDTLVLDVDTQYENSKECQALKVSASLSAEDNKQSPKKLSRTFTMAKLGRNSSDVFGSPISGKFTKTIQRIKSATDLSAIYKAETPVVSPLPPRRKSDEDVMVSDLIQFEI